MAKVRLTRNFIRSLAAPKRVPHRFKVGDWVCMFGQVTALHGDRHIVVNVGPVEATILTAECWKPEDVFSDAAKD